MSNDKIKIKAQEVLKVLKGCSVADAKNIMYTAIKLAQSESKVK